MIRLKIEGSKTPKEYLSIRENMKGMGGGKLRRTERHHHGEVRLAPKSFPVALEKYLHSACLEEVAFNVFP